MTTCYKSGTSSIKTAKTFTKAAGDNYSESCPAITGYTANDDSITYSVSGCTDKTITCNYTAAATTGTVNISCKAEGSYTVSSCSWDLSGPTSQSGTFTSSNTSTSITAKPGSYTVSSPSGGKVCDTSGNCGIRVPSASVSPSSFTLQAGKTQNVVITLLYNSIEEDDEPAYINVTCAASNSYYVVEDCQVNINGSLHIASKIEVTPGTYTISAASGQLYDNSTMDGINISASDMTVSPSSVTVAAGQTKSVTVTLKAPGQKNCSITVGATTSAYGCAFASVYIYDGSGNQVKAGGVSGATNASNCSNNTVTASGLDCSTAYVLEYQNAYINTGSSQSPASGSFMEGTTVKFNSTGESASRTLMLWP